MSTRAVTAVFQMVRDLNALSDEGYEPLQQAFDRIREQMQNLLEDQPHQDGPNIMGRSSAEKIFAALDGKLPANCLNPEARQV